MPAWAVAAIVVPCFIGLDLLIVSALMRAGWSELTQDFPASPPAPGAVRRNLQSFKAGMYNFGFCVHVAVDEDYLHLLPARLVRWFGGRPASIPWGSIILLKPGRRQTKVKIKSATITGPTWCLAMATPASS